MTVGPGGRVINDIKELAPGVFWSLLWCPTAQHLGQLLRPDGHVLVWKHRVGHVSWEEARVPVVDLTDPVSVRARYVEMDLLLPTATFLELLPRLEPAISAVQLGVEPPHYLDLRRIKGRQLYRLLREAEWHVLMDTPANDFGQVMSPHREVVERAISLAVKDEQS